MRRDLPKIGFIGAGTVATALASGLSGKDYPVVAVASRRFSSAQRLAGLFHGCTPYHQKQRVADLSEIVFITTPDDAIQEVVEQIRWRPGQSVVHCSGADSGAILDKAHIAGAQVGVFHPLQTFASAAQAITNMAGITFSLEAEKPLLGYLKAMATALGGRWMVLKPEDRVAYHASAVIASNYLVTLVKLATDLWNDFGISREEAIRALLPLVKGTLNNIESVGVPQCLTGPISRGDIGTIGKHLEELHKKPDIESAYRELALATIPVALAKGRIDSNKASELKAMFNSAEG